MVDGWSISQASWLIAGDRCFMAATCAKYAHVAFMSCTNPRHPSRVGWLSPTIKDFFRIHLKSYWKHKPAYGRPKGTIAHWKTHMKSTQRTFKYISKYSSDNPFQDSISITYIPFFGYYTCASGVYTFHTESGMYIILGTVYHFDTNTSE